MTSEQTVRVDALAELGNYILEFDERLQAHMSRAMHNNPWFTMNNQRHALTSIAEQFLQRDKLITWIKQYGTAPSRKVGIIAAGNIPVVAFHDILCSFVCGHETFVKLSDRDKYLLPFLIKKLGELLPGTEPGIHFVDKLQNFDAVIATGSNNSARYFHQYFGTYPHIIRKNRNGIAVLSGDESDTELEGLADDVFTYFGLGCRNVSYIKVPDGFDLSRLKSGFNKYANVIDHNKYKNNFDYNLAIFILNKDTHLDLENIIMTPSDSLISPVGCLHYSEYGSEQEVVQELKSRSDEIQCVVSHQKLGELDVIAPGQAQVPTLSDYADGIDTMEFLTTLQ